jgi:predicted lipoprotein with Yx(FWY)xxD motif
VRHPLALGATASTAALILAGCGSASKTAGTTAASGAAGPYARTTSASTGTSASSAASAAGMRVSSKPGKLGTILAAGPKKLTVYLFEGDKGAGSSCTGSCAAVWPPVTTAGNASAAGSAISADLGTIARSDGTKQVTYKGHPLYYFAKDGDSGDAYGQAISSFGADWYVVSPSGSKVDRS